MAILGFDLEEIARLIAIMEERELDEIVIKEEGRYLRVRSPRRAKPQAVPPPVPIPAPASVTEPAPHRSLPPSRPATPPTDAATGVLPSDQIALTSPMVGTFYRAEKVGAAPLVEIGQHVTVGQAIGIIEAMKIFSEVEAEHAGTIVAIPAKDGELVQNGAPLVIIREEA